MSPAEYLELRQLGIDGAAAHAMNAVSILVAYLLAMYFSAKNLSNFQIVAVTAIYTIFLIFPVQSSSESLLYVITLLTEFMSDYPEVAAAYAALGTAARLGTVHNAMMTVFFLAWVLSILFMLSLRKDKENLPNDT
jgi:hypothetical protein